MEYQEIKKIIKDMENLKLDSLEIQFPDGTRIAMKKNQNQNNNVSPAPAQAAAVEPKTEVKEKKEEKYNVVTSPIVGTFYTSPSPKEPPFVKIGDKVRKGDVLCVIEAMKLMNEIKSEYDGEIVEICVGNEEMVDFGAPLFKIK